MGAVGRWSGVAWGWVGWIGCGDNPVDPSHDETRRIADWTILSTAPKRVSSWPRAKTRRQRKKTKTPPVFARSRRRPAEAGEVPSAIVNTDEKTNAFSQGVGMHAKDAFKSARFLTYHAFFLFLQGTSRHVLKLKASGMRDLKISQFPHTDKKGLNICCAKNTDM